MQADGKQKKGSVYSKRNSNSIAVPIEIDPDSDFNEGPIPIEVKKKTKRKSAKRQERDSMDDSDVSEKPRKKKRKTKEPARKAKRSDNPGNPLLEFFTKIDIYSDSSEEEPEPMEDEPSYDAEDDASEAEEGNDQVAVNKFAAYAHRKAPPSPPAVGTGETTDDDSDNEILVPVALKPPRRISNSQPADSETEPDSSSEYGFPVSSSLPSKSKPTPKNEPVSSLPSKPKPTPKHDPDSDPDKTDSDEDFEVLPPCKVAPVVNTNATAEATRQKELKPRPGFPLGADQSPLGPMVLDAKQGIQVPATINTYLRDYQREGVKFFWERYNEGCGALLGDDMGLGKTIQVISFLSAIMKKEGIKTDRNRRRNRVAALQERKAWKKNGTLPLADAKWPTCLIIAPSTVVMNWEREFKTWGYFEVGKYVGTPEERKVVLADFKKGRLDVVLTSLDLARRDISLLDDLPWSCVFVDEVHTVKNPKSKTSVAYNEFECVRRFGLTGTAIQNSYDELWTILDWTNPGKLGNTSQWRHFVSNPLKNGQSATATDEQRRRATVVSEQLHKNLLPRFFLRRTKDIIAHQLPQKSDEVVFCPLTDSQIRVYKNILAMDEVQAVLNRDELCECGSGHQQKHCCVPFDSATIFKFMSVLIKLSNHLGLILPSPNDTHEQMIRNRELAAIAFPRGNAPTLDMAILDPKKRYCGKWKVLLGLLQEWKQDPTNKVLIFTKSVKLLDMMVHQLQAESYRFLRLDGNTKHSDRMPMIDEFHRDPNIFVFLISTMAGGTGLNLTGANKVVIFDPSWNPAHDLQAMDRAFRFGQTRDVSVFRLLGAGSVEELIYARQVYKQQQMKIGYENSIQTRYFAGVQGDKSKQGELFGLKNIFKLHEGGLSTKTAIEKAHLAELDWALGSMDAPKPKSKRKSDIDIAEVETKLDKEYNELKGLGALLFDDTPIPVSQNADKTAVVRGMYTHKNPDLLVASKIEQERTKDIVQKARRKPKKSDVTSDGSPAKQWPPVRVHRKNKAPPKCVVSVCTDSHSNSPRG
ncbi:P-loop containing nucleoside triphosphate hydrolase protein [Mycena capillaripes]|nr:P-loop containing nucleoside triphosphate hydrolase protein [Mycena capillaripes]